MAWLLAALVLLVVVVVRRRAGAGGARRRRYAHRGYGRRGTVLDTWASLLVVLLVVASLALDRVLWRPLRSRAGSRRLRPRTARWLAGGRCRETWWVLARNPVIPAEVARSLLHGDEWVQQGLAGNPAIPVDVARSLLHGQQRVLESLAGNPAIPVDVQRALAAAEAEEVRAALAGNRTVPVDLQQLLAGDDSDRVRCRLARNPALERDLMLLLVPDADDEVRASLAANPVLPVQVQHTLAEDPGDSVRRALAGNPCLAAGPMAALARRAGPEVAALARRDDLGPQVLRLLLAGPQRESAVAQLARRGDLGPAHRWRVRDLDGGVRGAAVAILTTYRQLPLRAAAHADPLIRVAVTVNPGLPGEHLEQLLDDPHPEVRHAARQRVLAGLAVEA